MVRLSRDIVAGWVVVDLEWYNVTGGCVADQTLTRNT